MTLYHKNKTICIIYPTQNEPSEHFIDRCNFITSQKMSNNTDYNKVITYSKIYTNTKYLGCSYDDVTTKTLNHMIIQSHT
jgi:hypothetical protein